MTDHLVNCPVISARAAKLNAVQASSPSSSRPTFHCTAIPLIGVFLFVIPRVVPAETRNSKVQPPHSQANLSHIPPTGGSTRYITCPGLPVWS